MTTLPPRYPYQEFIVDQGVRLGKTAVIAPPGAGKTRPIVDIFVECGHIIPGGGKNKFPNGPIFVICSGPAVATWKKQFPQWANDPTLTDDIFHMKVPPAKRAKLYKHVSDHGGILIMSAACFRADFEKILSMRWAGVIADEYHKFMRRKSSTTYTYFLKLTRHWKTAIITTGSVVRRDPTSMFTAFQIIDPKLFSSYWRFANTYCKYVDGQFGREMVGLKNIQSLRNLMDRYMAYVPKEVAAEQQPEGSRQALDVEMTPEQARIYKELSEEMMAMLPNDVIVASTELGKLIQLRQLLCCPKILDESLGMGAGFEAIVDKLEDDPHAAIFVPFRPAVNYVRDELRSLGFMAEGLKGGVDPDEQYDRIQRVKAERGVLVCTIQYAESFDFETACKSYFLGYDYTVDQNEQAEGRTTRAISEHEFVTWQYIKYMDTLDEFMLHKLNEDMRNVGKILRRTEDFIKALQGYKVVDQNN